VSTWSDYQEEVAEFFRSLGLRATTNATVVGARTTHNVDVLIECHLVGLDVRWIVECKAWKTAIPKEKVLALRTIVNDCGVDRGVMMAESGYQSGALEASLKSNVQLTSMQDLRERLSFDLGKARLDSIRPRVVAASERYWAINKSDRIDFGLRPEVGAYDYMGDMVIRAVDVTERLASYRGYPLRYDRTWAALASLSSNWSFAPPDGGVEVSSPAELFEVLDAEMTELERRLGVAETSLGAGKSTP
jgi:restriction system protein